MADRLNALRLFVRVAHLGSISAASRELGLAQPTASRMLAAFEEEIGAQLVARTTRAVRLTEAGAAYLERIETALTQLDAADDEARGSAELRGVLRVALSSSVAVREIIPRLPSFVARHPALRLDLLIEDGPPNLTEQGIDVSVRVGPLPDSTALVRRVGRWPIAILASPGLLETFGRPTKPSALTALPAICHADCQSDVRTFRRGRRTERVALKPAHVIGSNEGRIAAASAGLGFIVCGTLAARREVEQGRLIRVLSEWDVGSIDLNLIFRGGLAARPAVRAFAEFILSAGIQ